jgi:hypothetical protein
VVSEAAQAVPVAFNDVVLCKTGLGSCMGSKDAETRARDYLFPFEADLVLSVLNGMIFGRKRR